MKEYRDIIDEINNIFVNEFNKVPDFDVSLKQSFFKNIEEYTKNASSFLATYNQYNIDMKNKQEDIDLFYKKNYEEKSHKLKDDIISYKKDCEIKVSVLKENIEKLDIEKQNKIKGFKNEKITNTAQTNPLIYNQLLTKNKNLTLYDIYKKNAYNKYNDIVDTLLNQKEEINNQITSTKNKTMFRYNKANDSIIETFQKKRNEYENNIRDIDIELNGLKISHEKNILSIEIRFNTEVKEINDKYALNNNLLINQNNIELNEIESQNEKMKMELQTKRSLIYKTFISSIEQTNNKIDLANENTKRHIAFYKKEIKFKHFLIDQEINKLYYNSYKNKTELNHDLLNKLQNKKEKVTSKYNIIINHINNKNKKIISNLIDKKFIYERIKNTELEKASNVEEIEENNYKNKLAILNQSKDFTSTLQNRKKEYEIAQRRLYYNNIKYNAIKDYKIKQNNLYIKKQKNQIEIDLLDIEISLAHNLEEQVIKTDQLERKISTDKNNLHYLLEIERNKIIKDFTTYKIDNYIQKANAIYNYEEKNLFYTRDKKNELLDMNIKKANIDYAHNKKICGLDIFEATQNETFLKQSRANKNNYEITTNKIDENYKHFNIIKNQILFEFETLKKLISPLINYIYSLEQILNNNKNIDLKNLASYESISKIIISNIKIIIINMLAIGKEHLVTLINSQISFETGSKYESMYQSLEQKYNNNIKVLLERRDDITSTIDNYNNAIKSFYQQLAINEAKKTQTKLKYDRGLITSHEYKHLMSTCKNDDIRFHKLINKNEDLIDGFRKILDKIPHKKNIYDYDFNRKKQRLEREKKDEASVLYSFLKYIDIIFEDIENKTIMINISKVLTKEKLVQEIHKISYKLTTTFSKFIERFLNNVIDLENNVSKKNHMLSLHNSKNYLISLRFQQKLNNKQKNILQNNIKEENTKYALEIKDYNAECDSIIKKYDNNHLLNRMNYNDFIKKLSIDLDDNYKNCHNMIISTSLNINDNIINSNKSLKNLSKENNQTNMKLVNYYSLKKKDSTTKSNNLIKQYEQTLYYIPIECKEIIRGLKKDLYIYNKQFNKETKINQSNNNIIIKQMNNDTISKNNRMHNIINKYNKIINKCNKQLLS